MRTALERATLVKVLKFVRTLPVHTSRRRTCMLLAEAFEFDWRWCNVCKDYIPPKYFHKKGKWKCANCANLLAQRNYYRKATRVNSKA